MFKNTLFSHDYSRWCQNNGFQKKICVNYNLVLTKSTYVLNCPI